jgi:hypothetical protein
MYVDFILNISRLFEILRTRLPYLQPPTLAVQLPHVSGNVNPQRIKSLGALHRRRSDIIQPSEDITYRRSQFDGGQSAGGPDTLAIRSQAHHLGPLAQDGHMKMGWSLHGDGPLKISSQPPHRSADI